MKFTKKQRNAIYKKGLKMLQSEYFICHALSTVVDKNHNGYHSHKEIAEMFPEIKLFSPDDEGLSWPFFDKKEEDFLYNHDRQSYIFPREIVLDFCIEMTK